MARRLALLLLLALPVALPRAARAVDLAGTWYVLVHYKDDATNHPERERWEDRLWVFERQGDRLEWTDYPIVVFEDESGRFEGLGTNRQARVLSFWEPNEGQLADIADGLEYNPRGSRSKTLKGSQAKGWSSGGGAAGYGSARYITYSETWNIDDPDGTPSFSWSASMGSAASESVEGMTRFAVESVDPSGDLMRGSYSRDGARHGTFRMMRTGAGSKVRSKFASEGERAYVAFFGEMGRQLYAGEVPGGGTEEALRTQIDSGAFTDEDRRELRLQFEKFLHDEFERQGNDPNQYRPQIQSLARQMTDLVVDDGKSIEEVGAMLQDGRLRP